MNHQPARIDRQRGASTLGTLTVVIFGALLVMFAIKLFPIYLDDMAMTSVLENLQETDETKSMTPRQIKETIEKRFNVNNVENLKAKDLKFEEDGNTLTVIAEYEVRSDLFRNIDIVVSFNHQYQLNTQ